MEQLVIALTAGLLGGAAAALLVDRIRYRREKRALVDLFLDDIHTNWRRLDELRQVPDGPDVGRSKLNFRSVENVNFKGVPEYSFPVFDSRFYEVEGVRLAASLSGKARREFWAIHSLFRDAESARQVLASLPSKDEDYVSYQRLFSGLVEKLADRYLKFEEVLRRERESLLLSVFG